MMTIFLTFLQIFSFPINFLPEILNSSRVSGVILIFICLFNKNARIEIFKLFKYTKIIIIFYFLLGIILFAIVVTLLHGANDFTIISSFINQILMLIITILLCGYLIYKRKDISQQIIFAFICQSLIQLSSMISPSIREIFNTFRNQNAIDVGMGYGNIRALGLSGSAFFGLGVGYAICYVIYLFNWEKLPFKNNLIKMLILCLLIVGGQSAARTSIVGLVFGILLIIVSRKVPIIPSFKPKSQKFYLLTVTSVTIIPIIIYKVFKNLSDNTLKVIETYKNFVLQIFYNYNNTGSFSTNSTNVLFNRMYFMVPYQTFIFGDGKYTDFSGKYYMETDAGFMRNILFWGAIGTLISFLYQLLFFDWKNKRKKFFNLTILLTLIVCHIKGEVISYLIISQVLVIMLLIESLNERNLERERISFSNNDSL
ncbi:hypothetical protein FKY77_02335 [Enterococcus faecium]|uniref:hypothetical protein n=1 Tax=Enterococcus faecium TaxID=1352 RepID=UPI000CF3251F|nr:hypothetical protein [Enterococcus faecium]PQG69246.1 hypothetical protein CUS63_02745 [Enterococcus faecium]TQA58794.1 hypothetical protein FKY87_13960 [Enterococcus faecium]TQA59016.1 hypothetical protein FKY77_02335 [Enterococcus faecium]